MHPLEEPASWKILIVDDDEGDYVLAQSMLSDAKQGKCIVDWARTYEAGRQALLDAAYDAALVDYDLGTGNGLDLIREAVANGSQTPFILYTGQGSFELDQEAQRAGATFYLTKGETGALMLERGIRYAIERKQIEAPLQQRSQELEEARAEAENEKLRLEAVMEALPVGVAITDEQGGNISSNSAFEQVWGAPRPAPRSGSDYAAYKAWWADTGQAVRPDEWASVQAVLQGKAISAQHFQIQRFDGTCLYVLNGAAPVRDRYGKIVGSAVAIQDVTPLVETEEELRKTGEILRERNQALRESEQKYLLLFQRSAIAAALTKIPQNVFVDVNDAFEKLFGFTRQEVFGKTSLELGVARPEEHAVTVAEVNQRGSHQGAEKHFRTKSGDEIIALINVGSLELGGQQYTITTIQDVTEQKRVEAALRTSEERFRSVLENSRDVIYSMNTRTGRFEYISPSIERVMGYTADELMVLDSEASLAMVHPDDLPGMRAGLARLSETGRGELEYRQRTKDGGYCWLSNHASVVYDAEGRPLFRHGNIRDVTALKQAEAELQDSEAKYRNLFNTMDEAFCIVEMVFDAQDQPVDYRFLETNAMFENQTGLHEAQGKLMRKLVPAHEEYWFEIYGKIALTGESQRFVNEARALNRWYDVYAYRVGKPEDRHVAILFNDISRFKILEAELTESERKYRDLVQFAPAAIYELDFHTRRFLSVNDAMCQMSGYSREELLQMTPADLLDEPSQRLFQKRIFQWLSGEKPDDSVEYRVITKDGSERYASLNVTFTRDETGMPGGATVVAYDVTQRRLADLLLKERSDAIQEYSRRLERSNRELENFAFIASHDLQEPLRKIESFGGLLSELASPALGETEHLYIERMRDAAGRMRRMIDDLLALSRVSSAGSPFEQVDLNGVLRAAQDDLETRLRPVDGKIFSEDLPVIEADPVQMHQLFQNLIGNAIKFHQPGVPPVIRISARVDGEETGKTVTLLVADNGIGFDDRYLDRIFEPFQRLHGRSEYEGNGIGLAICKRIVERHRGAITAHSQPDQGSTFSVTLPVKQG